MRRIFLFALGAILCLSAKPVPCLWDYDTLAQERSRFPSALELVTGKFPRHSDDYYRWRIEDREARRAAGESSPELFDDIAVAHDKLREHQRAIALMKEKESLFPGLYETAANHGTFLIHAGRLEQGADEIRRAITINPDAHFGREIYQELLVRYVIERREAGATSPLYEGTVQPYNGPHENFWTFLVRELAIKDDGVEPAAQAAVKGLLGMLRFGYHDSPILLEALADVLLCDPDHDGKRLACRALLKAGMEVDDEAAKKLFRKKASIALSTQTVKGKGYSPDNIEVAAVEASFKAELADADAYWNELVANERAWIAAGDDVDARFHETYYAEAAPEHEGDDDGKLPWMAFALMGVGIALVIWGLSRR